MDYGIFLEVGCVYSNSNRQVVVTRDIFVSKFCLIFKNCSLFTPLYFKKCFDDTAVYFKKCLKCFDKGMN